MIYHIVSSQEWAKFAAHEEYAPPSLEVSGFIHFSSAAQLAAVARRVFSGQRDLLIVEVDESELTAELRYEATDGDAFPHLYGPLNLDAVVGIRHLPSADADPFPIDR